MNERAGLDFCMSEPGWTFVGGGNIASPKVIPEYYVTDEDKSVS